MSKNNPTLTKTLSLLPGCSEHDHATWLIGPCGVHRDSDSRERGNWIALIRALDAIDPDGNDHEVHRFGHWAVGWVEEMATRPESACFVEAEAIADALTEYPVVSDDVLSEVESEDEAEAWGSYARREFCQMIDRVVSQIDPEHEHISYDPDDDSAFELWRAGCDAFNLYVEHDQAGPEFPIERWEDEIVREEHPRFPWSDWARSARAELAAKIAAIVADNREATE